MVEPMLIARGTVDCLMLPGMANRHGLIAGATGTGKTVTLHTIAEKFSNLGVPVLLVDVKGDLAGLAQPGGDNPKVTERIAEMKLEPFAYRSYSVTFWDVYGQLGHPVRATISDLGPLLISRLLGLNETQGGVLTLVFKYADDNGLLLLDLKDLRAAVQYVGDNRSTVTTEYGNVSPASIGAIQRGLLQLEVAGGEALFGEPALEIPDLFRIEADGRGVVNILAAEQLFHNPSVYATFLLYLLSDLFEELPEVGDAEKPKFALFLDEAHLLFDGSSKMLVDKIEQVVRLIRSKGVGVYFITQNPIDLPETVLGQLGNRVQHALRSYTPKDQKAVKSAAETFRINPDLDVATVITELGTGEALISFLDEQGAPGIVQRAFVLPPQSKIGAIEPAERQALINASPLHGKYETAVDRVSAYEILKGKTEAAIQATAEATAAEQAAKAQAIADKEAAKADAEAEKEAARLQKEFDQAEKKRQAELERMQREAASESKHASSKKQSSSNDLGDIVEGAARSFGTSAGRSLVRGLLGTLTKGR
jgi:DNA helicase HerA-like ATPase